MASYIPIGRQQFCDANGVPLAAGSVGMYIPGTLTAKNTWQDSAQTILNANPVALDSGGWASIYGTGSYRQIVKDSLGNTIWDQVISGSDASTLNYTGTSPGAVTRTLQLKLGELPVSAEDYGAVGDGTVDDTAALAAARVAAGPSGIVLLRPGKTYAISSTIVLSGNGGKLIGGGAGDVHDTGTAVAAPTIIKWIGASGGTMVQVKSATTQFIAGNEFRGIFLDGNSALAAVGLNLVGCRLGTYEVVGDHFSTAILKMDPDPALSEPAGCSENRIIRLSGYQTNAGDGAHLLQTSTATYNCSQNEFELISGDFRNSYAIDIQGSDSEQFELVKLYSTTGATGIRLKAGATVGQAARNNMFHCVAITSATVPVLAEGTGDNTFASVENNILFLDTANNPALPTINTGASLWWGTVRSPIGTRIYTPASGSLVQQDASGKITQSGVSNTIAANASQVITLPKALTTGAMAVSITPKTAATTFFAGCSATQLTINNAASGASTDFYWRVEGF